MANIAVFVPAFNEAETIGVVLSMVSKQLFGHRVHIVVADDCSTDETVAIARQYTPHVLTTSHNEGVGACTRRGLQFIDEELDVDYVIKLDGDGQHDTRFLRNVATELLRGNDLVLCSRFHPESIQPHTPKDRILLNSIFAQPVARITSWEISDARTGFMGFSAKYVSMLARTIIVQRYGIPMEIILRIWNQDPHATIREIAHPAMYGPNISQKLTAKYSSETVMDKADRLQAAYAALLMVIEDLGISDDHILVTHGYRVDEDELLVGAD